MKSISVQSHTTPAGILLLGSINNTLCLCDWQNRKNRDQIDNRLKKHFQAEFKNETSDVIEQAKQQIDEYFKKERTSFNIPLAFAGTELQQQTWQGLLAIPYGQTASYGQLATSLGRPTAVRAIANANGANALSLFVPCHRVIGTNGTLTGYAGGLDAKQIILNVEQK